MFMLILGTVLLGSAIANPQHGGYNYNQGPFNKQPLQQRNQGFNQQQQTYSQSQRAFVPITSYQNDVNTDGSYQYSYSSGDGSQQQARGFLKNSGQKNLEAQAVQGSYSYTSPDGTPITVTYIADENGFRAEGAHLPTPPPIPDAIARSLQLTNRAQSQGGGYNQQSNQFQQLNQHQNQGIYNKYGQYN